MAKSRPNCHYCGQRLRDGTFTKDHVVPRAQGGVNAKWNLTNSCARCNNRKGASSEYRDHCLRCQMAWAMHEGVENLLIDA